MKKLLLAAVAVIAVASASSSFAGGCGTSYVTVTKKHCEPTYIVQEPYHKQVIYQPVHVQEKVIVKQPCYTTYVKPCVQTYKVHTPVIYNFDYGCRYTTPLYNYHYAPTCGW
jgi:hypothetical protein